MSASTRSRAGGPLDAIGVTLGLTVLGFLIGSVATAVVSGILGAVGVPITDPVPETVLSVLMLQGIGFGSVALVYLAQTDWTLVPAHAPTSRDLVLIGGGIIALFGVLVGGNLLAATLGAGTGRHQLILTGADSPGVLLILIPLSVVLIGPAEELLFRGVIQGLLVKRLGTVSGIGIASLIFALVHAGALVTAGLLALASSMAIYLMLSLILGVVYEYSHNIVVPALIHGAFNAVQFGLLYYTIVYGSGITPAIIG